nr:hypothetical protein [uncultured Duganella sp.]
MYQLLARECDSEALAIFAYAVYKRHKAEFLRAMLEKTGMQATAEQLETFYLSACTSSMCDMYIQQAELLMADLVGNTLDLRECELERDFLTTKIGQQLQGIQTNQQERRTWKGWAAEVSGNLAVNFVTILVIAALLFGFRELDQLVGEFGRDSGVLQK